MKEKDNGLQLSKYITPGAKIELEAIDRVLAGDGTYKKKKFNSKVVDVIDEDHLEILMPMEQTKLVLLPVNGQYDVHFFTQKGLYQCLAKVVNRYKNGNLYLLEIELISSLQKYQRREYYRYVCTMDCSLRYLSNVEKNTIETGEKVEYEDLPFKKGTIVDISGGGLRLVADTKYEDDDLILMNYVLGDPSSGKEYKHIGKILSIKELENNKGSFEHRISLENIPNKDREQIIRFIFEEERKKRNKD